MPKKEESTETILTREVKALYFGTMGQIESFHYDEFDRKRFRHAFAVVAHRRGFCYHKGKVIVTDRERADRKVYGLYLGIVEKRLKDAIKRLRDNEPIRSVMRHNQAPHQQATLPLFVPPPEQFRKWRETFKAAHSA